MLAQGFIPTNPNSSLAKKCFQSSRPKSTFTLKGPSPLFRVLCRQGVIFIALTCISDFYRKPTK